MPRQYVDRLPPLVRKAYRAWSHMKTRCTNDYCVDWENYGGRGIRFAPEWESFSQFLADMGLPPSPDHTLDRRDNEGWYTPANCRWATRKEQAQNKRVYANSPFGISGVNWSSRYKIFQVNANGKYLAKVKDFFEACCIRKSWESQNGEITIARN